MPFTFANLSFETPEATSPELDSETEEVRLADQWTETIAGEGWEFMIFSAASVTHAPGIYNDTAEKFGDPVGWAGVDENYLVEFQDPPSLTELEFFIFDSGPSPQTVEDFENAWSNDGYLTELPPAIAAPTEDFETNWGPFDGTNPDYATKVGPGFPDNGTYFNNIGDITTDTYQFDVSTPEGFEDFEEEWDGNENYAFDIGDITTSAFMFEDGTTPVDDFENATAFTELINYVGAGAPPDGEYTVFLNGIPHTHLAVSETSSTLIDGLIAAISGTPAADVIPSTVLAGVLRLAAGSLPVDYGVPGVQAPQASLSVQSPSSTAGWTQRAFMFSI